MQSVGAEAGDLADDERARSIRQRQLADVVNLNASTQEIDNIALLVLAWPTSSLKAQGTAQNLERKILSEALPEEEVVQLKQKRKLNKIPCAGAARLPVREQVCASKQAHKVLYNQAAP